MYLANPIYITASLSFGLFQAQVSGKEQINSRCRRKTALEVSPKHFLEEMVVQVINSLR